MPRLRLLSLVLAAPLVAAAAPARADITVGGFMDFRYAYSPDRPPGNDLQLLGPHTQHDSFSVNDAHLALGSVHEHLRFALELDVGTDLARGPEGEPPTIDGDVQEVYGHYTEHEFGVLFGKFANPSGVERPESPDDFTVTRGYLFSLARPRTLTGIAASFQATKRMFLAAGVVNGWDQVADDNRGKTFLAKLDYAVTSKVQASLSGFTGPERASSDDYRSTADLVVRRRGGKHEVALEGTIGHETGAALDGGDATWWGAGVQGNYAWNDVVSMGARVEHFEDLDGARAGIDGERLTGITVTPALRSAEDHFLVRADLRADLSNMERFLHDDGPAKGQLSLLLQFVAQL